MQKCFTTTLIGTDAKKYYSIMDLPSHGRIKRKNVGIIWSGMDSALFGGGGGKKVVSL